MLEFESIRIANNHNNVTRTDFSGVNSFAYLLILKTKLAAPEWI
jgi:hypothetical protein